MKNIDELITDFIEMGHLNDRDEVVFTDEAKELIHEIAERCKNMPLVSKTQEEADKFAADMSPEDIYWHMLYKIIEAPTHLHMIASTYMLIPLIDRKLRGEELKGDGIGK